MVEEDATIVLTWPSLRVISGPYVLANSASDSLGLLPSFNRLPITGSGTGPGGSFAGEDLFLAI